ncbi:mechanosensitive ion channel family protein [Paenibacillus sp. CC-CFT747]|nr:mechanosensitive ion channel family protein [Paenibacillus sp. CC-CFT747]
MVNFITILLVVSQLGFNLGPLLAGAGVLGLAIGFGAQSMVKDVITGFFIIFEDQFAVGDTIQTGAFKGTVEAIGLRVTTLRTWTGEVHIIPNGTIAAVTNFSVHNSLAVIDISFSYEDDMEKTQQVLKGILHNLHEAHENIVKEPEILGIQTLGDSNFTLRIAAECKPNTQGTVTRVLNEGIKKALLEKQMEVPKINYSPTEKGG